MGRESVVYAGALVLLVVGIATLLVGEFFEGGDLLLPLGGGAALVAVGILTAAIGFASPPADADTTGEG